MTMADGICEVCNRPGAIGVASTIMPYSCAYCRECALRGAQPEVVFLTLHETYGPNVDPDFGEQVVTYSDGEYINFNQWRDKHDKTVRPDGGVPEGKTEPE